MKLIPTLCIAAVSCMLIHTADARPKHRVACKIHKAKHYQAVQKKRVVDTPREERIDRNEDGVIGRVEAQRARHHRLAVKNNR